MRDLVAIAEATQKTVDQFKNRNLKLGTCDCVQMMIAHARRNGTKMKVPKYHDPLGARAALRALNAHTIGEVMDRHFTRIAPHEAMLGDFVEMPGGCLESAGDFPGFTSLTVALGNGRVLGFHESIPFADILQPVLISGAWSIV